MILYFFFFSETASWEVQTGGSTTWTPVSPGSSVSNDTSTFSGFTAHPALWAFFAGDSQTGWSVQSDGTTVWGESYADQDYVDDDYVDQDYYGNEDVWTTQTPGTTVWQ